jgi:hypothetical protein
VDGPAVPGTVAAAPLRLGGVSSDFNEPLSTECIFGQRILILPKRKEILEFPCMCLCDWHRMLSPFLVPAHFATLASTMFVLRISWIKYPEL